MYSPKRLVFSLLSLAVLVAVLAACTLPSSGGEPAAPSGDTAPTADPAAPSQPSAAIAEISGAVETRPEASAAFAPAQIGATLTVGGAVKTGADGRARLDFEDGTTVRVTPQSVFTIDAIETSEGGLIKRIQLEAGNLFIILNGGTLEVDTPSGQASVRGSYMGVTYNPETGGFDITCLEGTCTLQTPAGEVTLGAGETASVEGADAPPETGEMDSEDVQAWLDENPEAIVVVTELSGLLGDRLWQDSNANGLQDEGEPGVPNASVALFTPDGTLVDETTTNADGYYFFVSIPAGDYQIGFDPQETEPFTIKDAGDDALDSDANPDGLTDVFTYDGGNDLTRDAGLLAPGAALPEPDAIVGPPDPDDPGPSGPDQEDFMPGYNPLTGLPVEDPSNLDLPAVLLSISNFPVSARPQAGLSFASIIYEIYIGEGSTRFMTVFYGRFPVAHPPTQGDCEIRSTPFTFQYTILGNQVWVDANANGVQDVGELGLPGVCVNLLDASGSLVQSTTTDLNGYYGFDVMPGQRYQVEVVVPSGFALTLLDAGGNDNKDNDFAPATSRTALLEMTDAHNMSVDAGLILVEQPRQDTETAADTIAISDWVWFDMNGNGLQDEGERGVPNVGVELKRSGQGTVGTMLTDINGFYAFTGLDPDGDYSLTFSPPTGFGFTAQNADNNQQDTLDSDVDGFGQVVIFSHVLSPGANTQWDAGLTFAGNVHTGETSGGGDGGGGGIGPVRSGRLPYKYIGQLFPGGCLAYAGKSEEVNIPSCISVQEGSGDDLNANFLGVNALKAVAQGLNPPIFGLNYSGNAFSSEPPQGCYPVDDWIMFYGTTNQTKWVYDILSGGWQRFNDIADKSGNFYPSTDRLTGRQLIFSNVVVLFAEHSVLNSAGTIIDINLASGQFGPALLFRNGMVCDIYWSTLNAEYEQETGQNRPIKFVYEDGSPVPLFFGPTWVHIVTQPTCVADGPNAGDCVAPRKAMTMSDIALPYIRFFAP